ncbi:hypothetical protein [Actinoplanes teichomyceticus]|uniref:Uncharacterized protein n=1 Tax=Actinoplanes teichomyceticus TaxID=1867 RepID=A0A561WJY3_ACTTI|nr:hypothetical protein [Actinoplanes teichomyceticus]TWG24184.1 hypothetical protein FHX34_102737 [Actinoplanes teichomyceticus]GIF12969.1 hypothetical protein Ate01nite_30010 [Actinoplanes teichomyceticus]
MVTGGSLPGPGQLRLDPDSVAAAGRDLAAVAQRLADDVAGLQSAVGASDPFGTGESTLVVAAAYRAVVETALDALGSYTEQLGFAAATLVMQARSVAAADADGAAALSAAAAGAAGAVSLPGGVAGTGGSAGGGE